MALIGDVPRRTLRERTRPLRARARVPVRVTVAVAILAAVAVALARSEHHRSRMAAERAGATNVPATYGYARRCLVVTTSREFPDYARADFDHSRACGRYTGFTSAIFHRANGVWRIVLDASAYSCPLRGIPVGAQAALGVCWWSPRHRPGQHRK